MVPIIIKIKTTTRVALEIQRSKGKAELTNGLNNTHTRMRNVVSFSRWKCSFVGDLLPSTFRLCTNWRLKMAEMSSVEQDWGAQRPT